MSLNPGGGNYGWNYSNPNREGYSTQLVGTVLAIQEVQKRGYTMNGQPGAPEFWPDGNPKMNIRLALATETGELKTFTFQPAGKDARMGKKRSVHMDLYALTGNTDMMNLIGKTICIMTQEGHYGQGNPRPWYVSLVEAGPFEVPGGLPSEFKAPQVLANTATSGGQMTPPPQPQYQQPQYTGPQPQYTQPQYTGPQPQYTQPQYQPAQRQPTQYPAPYPPQPVGYQQPPMQQYPQGMDPSIANSMQTLPVQEQPVDSVGTGQVYDDESGMPF